MHRQPSECDHVLFIKNPNGMDRDLRKASIDAINQVNEEEYKEYNGPEILSRISQYQMAYKMQIAAPEVMNIHNEPQYIHDLRFQGRPFRLTDTRGKVINEILA